MTSSAPEDWRRQVREDLRRHERERSPGSAPAIDRFEILEEIGEGAAAVVYRARDRQLGREVALKVLRDPLGVNVAVRERFRREASVAAGFSHPNVVAVYDAGEAEGRLYLVMELVDGRPLDGIMRSGAGDAGPLTRLLEKAARGVAAVHRMGIVHRDLKPANILVTRDGEPKVGDFGLAHVAGSEAGLTRSGTIMGTPLYMSPEQVRGSVSEIRPETDVYALGAILYEILAGRPPHTGQSVTEIYGKIVGDDPAPPRRINPAAAGDLETIALKALEKDPARRYPTAEAFAEDLRRHLAGEPIEARAVGALSRLWRKGRRHRKVLAAFVAVLLLAGGVVAWAVVDGASKRDDLARAATRVRARDRFDRAGVLVQQGNLPAAILACDEALLLDPGNPVFLNFRGIARINQKDYAGAIGDFDQAIRIDPASAMFRGNRGGARWHHGDFAGAIEDCSEAIRLEPANMTAFMTRGLAKESLGEVEGALEDFRRTLDLAPGDWSNRAAIEAKMEALRGRRDH